MTIAAWAALLLAGGGEEPGEAARTRYAQMTFQQRIIVRVPTRPPPRASPLRVLPEHWREKNGPRCVAVRDLAGAQINRDGVDLMLKGGRRVRAKLESDCPALDYYSGFYLRPGADGKVCEDRDSIRARSGGKCQIDRFRTLVPDRKKVLAR